MRLLYWTSLYSPSIGGMEVIGAKLIAALQARGYEVCVATSHCQYDLPDVEERDGVVIHRFPFRQALDNNDPFLVLQAQRRLAALKRDFKPDVVHVNLSDAIVVFHLRTANAYPSKVVLTLHTPVGERIFGRETAFGTVLRAADWVTTVSEDQLAELLRHAPEIASCSSVILNGTDAPKLLPKPLPTDPPRLLCVGRMVVEKGFDVAIDAFASIARRWPTARLVMAGNGPTRAALEHQANALGVADRVDFLGFVAPEAIPAVMNDATIVIVPSRWQEPFGLVAMEAAQMARPVVATRVGGLPEVVVDGETGVLVEGENSTAIANAVASLLEHPRLAAQMGGRARERSLDVFSGKRCVDQYHHLYQQLLTDTVHAGRARLGDAVHAGTRSITPGSV